MGREANSRWIYPACFVNDRFLARFGHRQSKEWMSALGRLLPVAATAYETKRYVKSG